MAASISQTRYDYKIKVLKAIEDGKIVKVAFEKCPLCFENRKSLLCDICVNNGSFTHSKLGQEERFETKRQKWWEKQKIREADCRRFESFIEDIERANAKRTCVEAAKRKIARLKKAVGETQQSLHNEKRQLASQKKRRRHAAAFLEFGKTKLLPDLKQRNQVLSETYTEQLPTLKDICAVAFSRDYDVKQLISDALKTKNQKLSHKKDRRDGSSIDPPKSISWLKQELNLYHQYLAKCRAEFVRVLAKRIFPMEEVFARSDYDNLEMSMATALKDACETAFIGGRWVHVDHKGENHCTILGSTLPDYHGPSSALSLFAVAGRYAADNPNKTPVGNSSYGIYSALGYTILFTHLAARVLDILLPRLCAFSEVRDDLQEPDFCNLVWRLHQNIMHLAYSQEVDPDYLVDNLSLQNLMAIINSPSLGRTGTFEPDFDMPVEAEQCPLEYESESDEDLDKKEEEKNSASAVSEPDIEIKDWERVPAGLPSYDGSNMGLSSPTHTVPENSQSTAGVLFNTASAAATSAAATLSGWFSSYYAKK